MALASFFADDNDDSEDSHTEDDKQDCTGHTHSKGHRTKSQCPTVDISHISKQDFESIVYEPSADSYLLMDCIENDAALFNDAFTSKSKNSSITVLEIGCGSGIVSTHTYNVLKTYCKQCIEHNHLHLSVIDIDLNADALHITRTTLLKNGVQRNELTLIQSDLLQGIKLDMFDASKVDILIFNPPYVPTTAEELSQSQTKKSLSAAWSGGLDGRVIIDRFMQHSQFHTILARRSFFYLVTIAMNKPHDIIRRLAASPYHLHAEIVAKKRVVQEMLIIIRFTT